METKQTITLIQGKQVFVKFRLLDQQTKEDAWILALQTEFTDSKSREYEVVQTKSGDIPNPGAIEYDVSVTAYLKSGDTRIEELETAMEQEKAVEIWTIDSSYRGTEGENKDKARAKYKRGYVSEYSLTYSAEGLAEVEMSFAIIGKEKRGWCPLTEEESAIVDYPFVSTEKSTEIDPKLDK